MYPTPNYGLRKRSICIFDSDIDASSFAEFEISEFEIGLYYQDNHSITKFEKDCANNKAPSV